MTDIIKRKSKIKKSNLQKNRSRTNKSTRENKVDLQELDLDEIVVPMENIRIQEYSIIDYKKIVEKFADRFLEDNQYKQMVKDVFVHQSSENIYNFLKYLHDMNDETDRTEFLEVYFADTLKIGKQLVLKNRKRLKNKK